jgi:hypothetical protein
MREIAALVWLLVSAYPAVGKNRKDIPPAPLPSVVANAKKVFLSNGGGNNLAYDAFYAAMKDWGRYEIVGSPEEADLIVELAYRVQSAGTYVWGSTQASTQTYGGTAHTTGTTHLRSREIPDPQLVLTIYDAKTKNSLWSVVDHRRLARREKNREKETINSAERLVEELKNRADLPR